MKKKKIDILGLLLHNKQKEEEEEGRQKERKKKGLCGAEDGVPSH